jgi:hypothetical protein
MSLAGPRLIYAAVQHFLPELGLGALANKLARIAWALSTAPTMKFVAILAQTP